MFLKKTHLLLIAVLSGCSGDQKADPMSKKEGKSDKTTSGNPLSHSPKKVDLQDSKDAGPVGGAPTTKRIEFLEGRMKAIGAGFQLFSVEEITAILNEAEFLKDSGSFIASYENYLAEITDLRLLIASLAPLKGAPWKASFMARIFSRSELVTPENLSEIFKVCKNAREQGVLGESVASKIGKAPAEKKLALAQAFLDASDSSIVGSQIVGASIGALDAKPSAELVSWLLNLEPDIAELGDSQLLLRYAKNDPSAGGAFLQQIIDLEQVSRSKAAVTSFGTAYSSVNPRGAFEWAKQLPDSFSHARLQTLIFAFDSVVKQNPKEAAELLEQINDPKVHQRLASILERKVN